MIFDDRLEEREGNVCHPGIPAITKGQQPQCGNHISVYCSLFFVCCWFFSLRFLRGTNKSTQRPQNNFTQSTQRCH